MKDDPDFVCAICERRVCMRWNTPNRPDSQIPPICRFCEGEYGERAPQAGAFRDRRNAVQISALASALNSAAHIKIWEARYGRS